MEEAKEYIIIRNTFNLIVSRYFCLIAILLCCSWRLYAERYAERHEQFTQYTTEDGLSSDLVMRIRQDTCGHLWISSDAGVSVFDGELFKRFNTESYPSLRRNDLSHIHTCSNGMIFLGGAQGVLVRYDPVKDVFEDYSPTEFKNSYYKPIEDITEMRDGTDVILTTGGIYFYNEQEKRFEMRSPLSDTLQQLYMLSFYEDVEGRLWVSSFNVLYLLNKDGSLIKKYDLAYGDASIFSSKVIPISDSLIYVSCFSDILYEFRLSPDGTVNPPTLLHLPFSNLNDVLCDDHGHFWYTTDGYGLWYSDNSPSETAHYEHIVPSNNDAEYMQKLYCIMQAKNGTIWVGAQSSGLWEISPYRKKCVQLSSDFQFPKRDVSDFCEDEEGNVYVTSDGGGVYLLSSDLLENQFLGEANGLKSRNVLSIQRSSDGHFWLSSWGGGVMEYNPKTKQFRQERFKGLNSNLSCFLHVAVMKNDEIWVCTGGDGIYKRDTSGKWSRYILQFSEHEFDMWPQKVIEGADETRWIATSRSVWRVKGEERKPLLPDFSRVNSDNPLIVNDLELDREGGVYAATTVGIIRFSPDGGTIDTLDFIPKGSYSSVCMDSSGLLRASGDMGLISIDYQQKTFKSYNQRKKSFGNFHRHSSYQLKNGRVLWGTKNGFIVQNEVEDNRHKVNYLGFKGIKVGDLNVEQSLDYVDILPNNQVKSVIIPYNLSALEVYVDMVDYADIDVETYYMLKGLSDTWTPLPDNRIIKYSYLPNGEFELNLKVLRSGEVERTLKLPIVVMSPWWKRWWAIVMYVAITLLLSGGFYYLRMRTMKARQAELKRLVDERTKELDRKNEYIEQQNGELKLALADKDRVLSVIAHDLKNPMFAIVGALEGWLRKESTMQTEEKRGVITKVLSASQTLQEEMVRLLEWSRSKRERIDFNPSDVEIQSCLDNIFSLFSTMVAQKHITLEKSVNVEHCVWGDSRMLSTIFRNFINNAIKFTPEGGKITVKAEENEKSVVVQVVDTGVGMDKTALEALRSQGYCDSSVGTNNEKGTGLGFRICLDYIERNGGTFDVQSELGKGTAITVTLPKSEKKSSQSYWEGKETEKKQMEDSVDKEILSGNTVIVVDDDELILQNVADIMRPYMEVYTATNGEEALKVLAEHEVDLVLSDVEMPVMNGIELSRKLSQDERMSSVPFLFLSAKNEQSDRLLGLLSGAIDYIAKPFSRGELLMKVNNILRIRQNQQQRLLKEFYENLQQNETSKTPMESDEIENSEGEIGENRQPKVEEKLNPFVEKLMAEMEEKYADSTLAIQTIATSMGMSQSTLSRRTKTLLGKAPVEVLNEFRLNKALILLKEDGREKNISEVAYSVGFSDPAYFTRKFKDFYGFLPSSVK